MAQSRLLLLGISDRELYISAAHKLVTGRQVKLRAVCVAHTQSVCKRTKFSHSQSNFAEKLKAKRHKNHRVESKNSLVCFHVRFKRNVLFIHIHNCRNLCILAVFHLAVFFYAFVCTHCVNGCHTSDFINIAYVSCRHICLCPVGVVARCLSV